MKRSPLAAFVVASSLPVTVWPLLGLAIAAHRNYADFDFSITAIAIPMIFGLYHGAYVYLGFSNSRKAMLVGGAILGLILASMGTFIFDVPRQVYGLEGNARYLALAGGPLFYGAVWGLVLFWLESRLGIA